MRANILDLDDLSNIRQALLIGLSSFGEIERLTNCFELERMGDVDLSGDLKPVHPTGSCETVGLFADALRMVQIASLLSKIAEAGRVAR